MTSSRRAFELFKRLCELSEVEAASVLDAECGQDLELRQAVEKLLSKHHDAQDFLPEQSSRMRWERERLADASLGLPTLAGTRIGPYKILQEIGEGGFGVVYLADQLEPVRRQVALKVIKPGMDTRDVITRFEVERQTLALMDHPNIARVLDAATTDSGRPYFVMELVKGIPLTEFCDKEQLNTISRLKLFIKVCHAVQHAHQKGIIHRDLKPSNILVALTDGRPVPKVIDFGVAKAINQRLTEKTLFTQFGQMIGTPYYMSPEQAEMSGLDVDTRSDIYSLGVLLYELLTGTTPIEPKRLQSLGLSELQRVIQSEEPAKPSTRLKSLGDSLSVVCEHRRTDAKRLRSSLQGDLDWITMKCLEKSRSRRYETANELAADLERYLSDEPVLARPPSAIYKLRKAWNRHRVVLTAASCVVVALTIATVASLWQTSVAVRARADTLELLYAADLKLAQLALDSDNLARAATLLDRHRPSDAGSEPTFEWRYLWQQTQMDEHLAVLELASTEGATVAFSPDDRHLLIGTTEGLTIYDLAMRKMLRTLKTNSIPHEVHFSDDGHRLFISATDELTLWDTANWELVTRYAESTRPAAMSPDGRTVICNGPRGLQIREAESGTLVHEIEGVRSGEIWSGLARTIGFSADGTMVAALIAKDSATNESAAKDCTIRIWKVDELRQRGSAADDTEIQGRMLSSLKELVFSRDGLLLAGSSIVGEVTIWNPTSGQRLASLDLGSSRVPGQLAFSGEDNFLLAACWDQTVRGWMVQDDQLVESWRLRGHRARAISLAVSHDGTTIASGDIDGKVVVWRNPCLARDHGRDGALPNTVQRVFDNLQFLSGRRTLVGRSFPDRSLSFRDVASGKELNRFSDVPWPCAARVAPNQRWLALARANGNVDILDLETSQVVTKLTDHSHDVRRIYFRPDSRQLFTATVTQLEAQGASYESDDVVYQWQVPSGQLIRKYEFPAPVNEFVLDPSGDRFVVQLQDGTRAVIATDDGKTVWSLSNPEDAQVAMMPMAYTHDGQLLAAACDRGTTIRVYDADSGTVRFTTGILDFFPLGLAFTPDGRSLAVGGTGESVKFWSVSTGQETLEIRMPGAIYEIEFSNDAQVMAVATYAATEPANEAQQGVTLLRVQSWPEIASRSEDK